MVILIYSSTFAFECIGQPVCSVKQVLISVCMCCWAGPSCLWCSKNACGKVVVVVRMRVGRL